MPRNARLVNTHSGDDVVHRLLLPLQRFDDQAARGIGQGLEEINVHNGVYIYLRMLAVQIPVEAVGACLFGV